MDNIALIIASIVSSLGTILGIWLKNRMEYKKKECLETIARSGLNVYQALDFILKETNADRAYVFEFHNGEKFFSGRGQQKFSCTYETVRPGVSAECLASQSHRISNFNKYIKSLISEGQSFSLDVESVEDSSFASILKNKGVEAFYNVPIKTLNGKIIGILGVDYINSIDDFKLKEEKNIGLFMRRQARIIGGYLV